MLDADNAEVKGYRFAVLFSPETLFEELGAVPYFVKDGQGHLRQAAGDRGGLVSLSRAASA